MNTDEFKHIKLETVMIQLPTSSPFLNTPKVSSDIICELYHNLLSCKYEELFSMDIIKTSTGINLSEIESFSNESVQEILDKIDKYLKSEGEDKELVSMALGIAFLHMFVQSNFTGPTINWIKEKETKKEDLEKLIKELSINGENFYGKTSYPSFIKISTQILSKIDDKILPTALIWRARSSLMHQMFLDNTVHTLKETIENSYNSFLDKNIEFPSELKAKIYLEFGLFFHHFYYANKAAFCFEKARQETGLEVKLTGMLGRRTKFQTFDTTMLVLQAKSNLKKILSEEVSLEDEEKSVTPKEVPNDPESILLEKIAFKEETDSSNLSIIDQCIILSLCLDIKNNNPQHGLTTNEMSPYVQRVNENPNNWMVHSTCLLLKTRLESESSKTVERAALQLQVLSEQFDDLDSKPIERFSFFYQLAFPPKHLLKKELAKRFLNLGVAATAFEIFQDLEMWNECVRCHQICGKEKKAIELIEERLKIKRDPELLCVLGDIQQDPQHYLDAWEASEHRYGRAQRSLGKYYLRKLEYEKSIEHFQIGLKMNQLFPDCWFSLGCCAIQLANWKLAKEAFTMVIHQEHDDGQSWSNLASVFLQLKEKEKAFRAFTHATKKMRENWKIWENYLYIALDLKKLQESIYAVNRLFDIKGKDYSIDVNIFAALTDIAVDFMNESKKSQVKIQDFNNKNVEKEKDDIDDKLDVLLNDNISLIGEDENKIEENEEDVRNIENDRAYMLRIHESINKLINRATSMYGVHPALWGFSSRLSVAVGKIDEAIEERMKQCRSLKVDGWDTEKPKFTELADGCVEMMEINILMGNTKTIYSAKSFVRIVLAKTKNLFGETENFATLQSTYDRLIEKDNELKNN